MMQVGLKLCLCYFWSCQLLIKKYLFLNEKIPESICTNVKRKKLAQVFPTYIVIGNLKNK